MRILHVISRDTGGGSGKATLRLHNAMLKKGIDSHIYFQTSQSISMNLISFMSPEDEKYIKITKIRLQLERILIIIFAWKKGSVFSSSLWGHSELKKVITQINPDIVNLHWINYGFLSISSISNIKKPIVWTLCDMWPFTGGCHYSWGCTNFQSACGKCPQLRNWNLDLSKFILKWKKFKFKRIKSLTIVGKSSWISGLAKQSSLFKNREVFHIPNLLDHESWNPNFPKNLKKEFPISSSAFIILTGSLSAKSDLRKGHSIAEEVMSHLSKDSLMANLPLYLITFGFGEKSIDERVGFNIINLGKIENESKLKEVYNSANAFFLTSQQENLANTALESIFCGTPIVGFNVGGNPDIIVDGITGYLAQSNNTSEIVKLFEKVFLQGEALRKSSREFAVEKFSENQIVNAYKKIYEDIMNQQLRS